MRVWAPAVNRVSQHQIIHENLKNRNYWWAYGNETDQGVRDELLLQEFEKYEDPEKEKRENEEKCFKGEFGEFQEDDFSGNAEKGETEIKNRRRMLKDEIDGLPSTRGFGVNLMFVAKTDSEKPVANILTQEHFKEMIRFEQWLLELEYIKPPPGIARREWGEYSEGFPCQKLAYNETPEVWTFYDFCKKDNKTKMSYWPEDTPENCKLFPSFCPEIQPVVKDRCDFKNYPLDFFYEKDYQDYNFRQYSTNEELV